MTAHYPVAGMIGGGHRSHRGQRGFSVLEVTIVLAVAGIALSLTMAQFSSSKSTQGLRYGVLELAATLREAQERAKSERVAYTVTLTAGSSEIVLARSTGGFQQNETLPQRAAPTADANVQFSAFGQPASAYTITLQNAAGTATVSVTPMGGISTAAP